MRRLTEFELVTLIKRMERDYWTHRPIPPPDVLAPYCRTARLEFPLGELMNPGIAGFVWTWHLKDVLRNARIERHDRFNANGLEGK